MNRRDFLKLFGGVAVAGAVPAVLVHLRQEMRPEVKICCDDMKLPRGVSHPYIVTIEYPSEEEWRTAYNKELEKFVDEHLLCMCRRLDETDHALHQRILAKITKA